MGMGRCPSPFLPHNQQNRQMKKHQDWNNISKESLPTKLKKGEKAVYRILGIKGDPGNPATYRCPSAVNVPGKDRVYDTLLEEYVDIANIKSIGVGGKMKCHSVWFQKEYNGTLVLDGSKRDDSEIYEYLELCNYNASNPNRSQDVKAIFERVNPTANAEKKRKSRTTRRQALNAAAEMNASDVRDFAALMGWNDKQDLVILRDLVEDYADGNPTEFIKKSKNKQNSLSALINRAAKSNVIKFDGRSNGWKWADSNEVICSVSRGTDRVEGLVVHLTESANGAQVIKTLQSALK